MDTCYKCHVELPPLKHGHGILANVICNDEECEAERKGLNRYDAKLLKQQRDEARQERDDLRQEYTFLDLDYDRLREERDEARELLKEARAEERYMKGKLDSIVDEYAQLESAFEQLLPF